MDYIDFMNVLMKFAISLNGNFDNFDCVLTVKKKR